MGLTRHGLNSMNNIPREHKNVTLEDFLPSKLYRFFIKHHNDEPLCLSTFPVIIMVAERKRGTSIKLSYHIVCI